MKKQQKICTNISQKGYKIAKQFFLPENLKMVHLDKNREYTVGSRDEILARDGISREGLSKIVLETLRQK